MTHSTVRHRDRGLGTGLLVSLVTAAALVVTLVPSTFAADPSSDPAQPTATPAGPYDGTIVEDPTFVSGGELPTQPAATAAPPRAPGITPPPTDVQGTLQHAGQTSALCVLLLVAAGVLAVFSSPALRRHQERRSRRRT
jgi:hypothetical protein